MTPLELVTKASRRVNIIAHNETLSDSEAQNAVDTLNGILSNWSMRPLIARSGLAFPLAVTDAHTGMDDQIEYALINNLAIELAGEYGFAPPVNVVMAASQAVQGIERENILPIYNDGDNVLFGISR